VGLALAVALRRAGISVRIVDEAAQRSTTSKAVGLQYRVFDYRLAVASARLQ
jgi:2-polyprenyl-6-methoxyphenol hydroxylase-like FAD-dependent oxidoreductase